MKASWKSNKVRWNKVDKSVEFNNFNWPGHKFIYQKISHNAFWNTSAKWSNYFSNNLTQCLDVSVVLWDIFDFFLLMTTFTLVLMIIIVLMLHYYINWGKIIILFTLLYYSRKEGSIRVEPGREKVLTALGHWGKPFAFYRRM